MVRVVHIVETLERGGLERMVCDLATEQSQRGATVQVICLFRRGLLAAELQAAGVPVMSVEKQPARGMLALWRLRKALQGAAPDLIHTHNATAHYHTVAALLGARIAPVLNTRHGMGGNALADRRERWFRLAAARSGAVVAVCRHAAERFARDRIAPAALLQVVPNGIRVERFGHVASAAARARLGYAPDDLVLGTVGRLNWAKDHALLLQAFAQLAPNHPRLRLAVVGDGELRAQIQQQIDTLQLADRVRLHGDRGDVPAVLTAFDVFVLSSRTEGYSMALLEAAASGVPQVATDVGGNREIVLDGTTGRIVPWGEREALAAAIEQLLVDPALRRQMGAAARNWALRSASTETMADAYERIYGQLRGLSA